MRASGEALLVARAKVTKAKTVVIIQHYPSEGARLKAAFESARGDKEVGVLSAYGHTHNQLCQGRNSVGQCDVIMTGGGGGCCEGDLKHSFAGFTAVALQDGDGVQSFTSDLESSAVRMQGPGQCAW